MQNRHSRGGRVKELSTRLIGVCCGAPLRQLQGSYDSLADREVLAEVFTELEPRTEQTDLDVGNTLTQYLGRIPNGHALYITD